MPWTREDTRNYIKTLEEEIQIFYTYKLRVEYYLENKGISQENTDIYLKCYIIAFAWVAYHLDKPVSVKMIYDFIGVENDIDPNQGLTLGEHVLSLDFESIIELILSEYN